MLIPLLRNNGKYTLLNTNDLNKFGKYEYEYLDFFSNGFAIVKIDDKWKYIDENEIFLELRYDYDFLQRFSNGIAIVNRNDEYWIINKEGIEITKRGYHSIISEDIDSDLRFGLMKVEIASAYDVATDYDYSNPVKYVSKCNNGLLDRSGFEVLPPIKENIFFTVSENFILTREYYFNKQVKHSIVNFEGTIICETFDFAYISNFYKDIAIGISQNSHDTFILDKHLQKVKFLGVKTEKEIGCQDICTQDKQYFVFAPPFEAIVNGLLPIKSNNKWGLANITGGLMSEYKFDYLLPLNNGLIISGLKVNSEIRFGIFNIKFEQIVPCIYEIIKPFCEGVAVVRLNNKWGLINEFGKELIKPDYDFIDDSINGFLIVSKGDYINAKNYVGLYGLFDNTGKKLSPIVYDFIEILDSQFAIGKREGKMFFIEKDGFINYALSKNYDKVIESYNGFYLIERDDKKFVINDKGKEFIEGGFDYLPF